MNIQDIITLLYTPQGWLLIIAVILLLQMVWVARRIGKLAASLRSDLAGVRETVQQLAAQKDAAVSAGTPPGDGDFETGITEPGATEASREPAGAPVMAAATMEDTYVSGTGASGGFDGGEPAGPESGDDGVPEAIFDETPGFFEEESGPAEEHDRFAAAAENLPDDVPSEQPADTAGSGAGMFAFTTASGEGEDSVAMTVETAAPKDAGEPADDIAMPVEEPIAGEDETFSFASSGEDMPPEDAGLSLPPEDETPFGGIPVASFESDEEPDAFAFGGEQEEGVGETSGPDDAFAYDREEAPSADEISPSPEGGAWFPGESPSLTESLQAAETDTGSAELSGDMQMPVTETTESPAPAVEPPGVGPLDAPGEEAAGPVVTPPVQPSPAAGGAPALIPLPDNPDQPGVGMARCGECGRKIAYPKRLSGKRMRCPACRTVSVIP